MAQLHISHMRRIVGVLFDAYWLSSASKLDFMANFIRMHQLGFYLESSCAPVLIQITRYSLGVAGVVQLILRLISSVGTRRRPYTLLS